MSRFRVPSLLVSLFVACGGGSALAADAPPASATPPVAPAPAAGSTAASSAAPTPSGYAPLDVPQWAIKDSEPAAKDKPWILIIDDPQCPYCMQLSLGIEKARENADAEVSQAAVVHVFYPLPYHDQSAHIVEDAFCLQASRAGHSWDAASYLDWLIVAPWKSEPGWKSATMEDLAKDNGFFDAGYDKHRVLSSRRRDYQTEKARAEAACPAGACAGDADCEKLCEKARTCRTDCPPETGDAADASGAAAAKTARETCLAGCTNAFVSSRYKQFSRVHQACLLESGPGSAQAKTAETFQWCVDHKIPGTPTVYVGHPRIGFRTLGDSDDLGGFFVLLRQALAEARGKLKA